MNLSPIRVAVHGYGVIGKRVADAVRVQDDMALSGVADVVTDYRIRTAVELNVPLFGATEEAFGAMRAADLTPFGTLDDQIADSDAVVDCTPMKVAAANRERYVAAGRKAIFQGGEKHLLTECEDRRLARHHAPVPGRSRDGAARGRGDGAELTCRAAASFGGPSAGREEAVGHRA